VGGRWRDSVHCSGWWVRPCHLPVTSCLLPGTAPTSLQRSDTRRFGGGTSVSREVAAWCLYRGRLDTIAASYSGNICPRTGDSEIFRAFLLQNMYTDPVRTSKETHYVSATKPNRLMLFRETAAVYRENLRNTQIHCVGRMQRFSMVNQVVHIVTTGLQRVKDLPSLAQSVLPWLTVPRRESVLLRYTAQEKRVCSKSRWNGRKINSIPEMNAVNYTLRHVANVD
jgi:hypothetical protein